MTKTYERVTGKRLAKEIDHAKVSLYCIVLYCIVLYCIVLYHIDLHSKFAKQTACRVWHWVRNVRIKVGRTVEEKCLVRKKKNLHFCFLSFLHLRTSEIFILIFI